MRLMKKLMTLTAVLLLLTAPDAVLAQKKGKKADADAPEKPEDDSRFQSKTFAGLKLRSIGPAFMSGRIADVAVHPDDQSTWYVAVGSGNVFKTTNAGTTWEPIFDDQGSYSIGCVTLDPSHPETVWIGTGENVGGRHVGYGDGVYKSLDGGKSWQNVGLEKSEHIGNIVVDPRDSNTVFVASQGPLWSKGGERGLYKTSDGGETWERLLGDDEYVGVNEVKMDPRDPDVLYAATHQRFRTVAALINGGPGSGIHKSTDGGETWRELKTGLPKAEMGKIGLAISPIDPDVVYATIETADRKNGGFFRSANAGETWEKRNEYFSGGTGAHYYQEIFASPHQFDRVYQMDPRMQITEDGGKTFAPVGEPHKHGDNHAMAFDPNDPNYLLVGSDGGLYETWDLGKNWKYISNLPITQFYKVTVDYDEPFYNIYGGTQDNSTQGGPSRTDNNTGIRTSDWFIALFADGHQPAADPTDPNIVYAEWQQGNLVRFDKKTGEIVYVQPQPEPGEDAQRWNWDSPILISPHDHKRLYFASQTVYRSDDRGDSWTPISGDLSRGQDRLAMPMMDRVWSYDAIWDLNAMSNFGNVTSLAESPLEEGLIYAGTDDGLVQVTQDGGKNWRRIDVTELGAPENSFVNDIKADLHDANTVYVALDNHKNGDFAPYLVKSTDRGATWTSIVGDPEMGGIPERHLVWRLQQDHVKAELLFLGTEFGVFFTVDGGGRWTKLQGGVPNIPFRDLAIQKRENDLVGATFGRSFYIFDDYTPLRHVNDEMLDQDADLFPVKDAWWYIQRRPLNSEKGSMGADFFTAPNPPFGAVFTYYLKDGLKTRKAQRQEDEKKVKKEGGDTPYPGWDALRLETQEEKPTMILTVRDAAGDVVRHVEGPAQPGFHRVAWDLRYPAVTAWRPPDQRRGRGFGPFQPRGPLAAPGTYTVSLAQRADGVVTDLGRSQSFEVVRLREGTLKGMEPAEMVASLREVNDFQRGVNAAVALVGETTTRLQGIRESVDGAAVDDASLGTEVRRLERELYDIREALQGNRLMGQIGEPQVPAITGRLQVIGIGNGSSTYGPTKMHLRQFEIAQEQFAKVSAKLRRLGADLEALEAKLDAAGVPWTPGRGIPGSE